MLHSGSAVRRSRDRIGRSITILMVAIPLYCKSLGFQFETKLCIFQNISKYFFEKIPHVLPNVQRDENQADITKMLNVDDDSAEWDFGRVSPRHRTCVLIPETCVCLARGHANETVRFSKHNRWRPKEMQSVRTARAAASARGGPQLFANAHTLRPPQAAARTTRRSRIVTIFYAVRRRRRVWYLSSAAAGGGAPKVRAAEDNAAARRSCSILQTRQPHPRQKRFREKGGRGDGALRIGNLLIASKVPSGIRFSEGVRTPPKSFHRGGFWVTFCPHKR